MDNLKDLNDALEYIEEHLLDEIDLNQVDRIAGCSNYHFQRMFTYLAQISLHEYIKRRRLSLAAIDCINTNERILDIALKYGYQSNDSFTRAFVGFHGNTPSYLRKHKIQVISYPKLSFQLTVKGNSVMKVSIVEKGAFNLIGISKRVPIVFNGVNQSIMEMFKSLNGEMIGQLKSINDIEPKGIISASYNFSEGRMDEKGELDHLIGVHSSLDSLESYTVVSVPELTWAVFDVRGPYPDTLQNTWARIYSEWLPSNPYECVNGPEIVWNEGVDMSKPDYHSQIWIPITKISK